MTSTTTLRRSTRATRRWRSGLVPARTPRRSCLTASSPRACSRDYPERQPKRQKSWCGAGCGNGSEAASGSTSGTSGTSLGRASNPIANTSAKRSDGNGAGRSTVIPSPRDRSGTARGLPGESRRCLCLCLSLCLCLGLDAAFRRRPDAPTIARIRTHHHAGRAVMHDLSTTPGSPPRPPASIPHRGAAYTAASPPTTAPSADPRS